MIEAEENNNDLNAIEKLKEKQKNIADNSLNEQIKNYIEYCYKKNANNEKLEIKKLLEKKEFDVAVKKIYDKNMKNLMRFIK